MCVCFHHQQLEVRLSGGFGVKLDFDHGELLAGVFVCCASFFYFFLLLLLSLSPSSFSSSSSSGADVCAFPLGRGTTALLSLSFLTSLSSSRRAETVPALRRAFAGLPTERGRWVSSDPPRCCVDIHHFPECRRCESFE